MKKKSLPQMRSAFVMEFSRTVLLKTRKGYGWPARNSGYIPAVQKAGAAAALLGGSVRGVAANTASGDAFLDKLAALANKYWQAKPPSQAYYKSKPATHSAYRMAEICSIVHLMLVATVANGGGGPGGEMPPHN